MAKDEGSKPELFRHPATKVSGRFGIVIAFDPDPVSGLRKFPDERGVLRRHAHASASVMKTVAKRDHGGWVELLDQAHEPPKRCAGIIRRQHLAARSIG